MKIGVMWGSPETTTGGKALKFYASIRLDIRRTGNITGENDTIIGSTNRVKVVKNKVAPPFRQATFDVFYNQGISWEGSVVDAAAEHGILEKAGAWYSYNGVKIGQGREAAKIYLKENPDISKEIETKVKEKAGVIQPASKGKGDK
jgi:recombination protein RecA